MRQLVTTAFTTALRAPGALGDVLFKELDQVTYCEECRELVAERRQTEQLKFVGAMLIVVLMLVALPTYLVLT